MTDTDALIDALRPAPRRLAKTMLVGAVAGLVVVVLLVMSITGITSKIASNHAANNQWKAHQAQINATVDTKFCAVLALVVDPKKAPDVLEHKIDAIFHCPTRVFPRLP